jgi:predicted dehydrogenase
MVRALWTFATRPPQSHSMSNDQKVRVGIIGAGGIVKQRHLPGLLAIPGVEIVAVSNSTLGSAQAFCKEHAPAAEPVELWQNVADNDGVDVVWIGAPPYLHADASIFALQAGKHVFCQARMAAELHEAERMWEASMSFPDRVSALCPAPQGMKGGELVKKLLADGAIGTPHQMMLHSFSSAWLDASAPAHWRQRVETSGIQILTLGIFVEVMQRWLGDITEVAARGRVVFPQRGDYTVETPDFVNVLCKFRNGIEGALLLSGVAANAPTDKFFLYGSEGSLSYDFATDELLVGKRGETPTAVPIPLEMQREWTVEKDFIAAVRDPAAPRPKPDFTEGIRYMRVVNGVWDSMDQRATVKVA